MSSQLEMFPAESPTFAPWADPTRAERITIERQEDRDHVGSEEIGKLGNNRDKWVLVVEDADGEVLLTETFPASDYDMSGLEYARRREREIEATWARNRQKFLTL